MIQKLTCFFWLILFLNQFSYSANNDSCRIQIDAAILKNSQLKLGYYYGSKTLLQDDIQINNDGKGFYKNNLHKGIYFLLLPDSTIYEIMIDGNSGLNISIIDSNFQLKCKVQGNPITEAYDTYVKQINEVLEEINFTPNTNSSIKITGNKNARLSEEQKVRINEIQKNTENLFPGSLLQKYITAVKPVDIADLKRRYPGDSLSLSKTVDLYKIHYLDNVDLNDERLIYTPILTEKLNSYFDRIISQQPDTVIKEIKNIYTVIKNEEVKKFFLENQMDKYKTHNNKARQEYIYYKLIETIYLAKQVPWEDENSLNRMKADYLRVQPALLYQTAPDLNLPGLTNETYSLYSIDSDYTLLVFWNTDCPICTRIIRDINKTVSSYNYLSIKVFTICIHDNFESWVNYSLKNLPKSWINTLQLTEKGPSEIYNISTTPTIFLLDKEKVIIQKNFTNAELESFLLKIATGKKPI
jgi:thioredoxin-related protein